MEGQLGDDLDRKNNSLLLGVLLGAAVVASACSRISITSAVTSRQ